MNKYNVAEIIQNYLTNEGLSLTDDQAIVLAKNIRRPMWNWHIYIGYALTALFSIRFLLPLFGKMKFQNPLIKSLTLKEKFQKWTYIVFYICIAITLSTGLVLEFTSKEFSKPFEDIHVLSLYYLIPFIIIHISGVMMAEFSNQKGIIYNILRESKIN
jgi:cytochrome b561